MRYCRSSFKVGDKIEAKGWLRNFVESGVFTADPEFTLEYAFVEINDSNDIKLEYERESVLGLSAGIFL
ncbi:MAG: hypothetical protein ABGX69_00690 [Methylococcales bacterium]|jgi:hypothetical protein|nr:hypothetical protein [Methylococcaceae bacterium]HIL41244.1 hypothetical protein [Methylococcales bacterium]